MGLIGLSLFVVVMLGFFATARAGLREGDLTRIDERRNHQFGEPAHDRVGLERRRERNPSVGEELVMRGMAFGANASGLPLGDVERHTSQPDRPSAPQMTSARPST